MNTNKNAKRQAAKTALITSVFALLFSLLLGAVIIALSGYSPIESYTAIFGSSLGTDKGIALSLSQATPIMFTGLAFAIAFKVRMINTGAEGQLYAGGMAAAIVGAYLSGLPRGVHIPLAMLGAFVAGGLVALFVAFLKVHFGASEVITTLMLNNVIILFTSYLANGPLKPADSPLPQTEMVAESARLSKLVPKTQLTSAIFVAALVAVVLYLMLTRTAFGYEIQVTGLNKPAARTAGIHVPKTTMITFFISGAVAGLGGAAMVLGTNYRFVEGFSNNYGFAGISVAALAAYNPLAVIPSAVMFGILKAGAITLNRTTPIPVEFVDVIQVLVIIFVAAPIMVRAVLSLPGRLLKKLKAKRAKGG